MHGFPDNAEFRYVGIAVAAALNTDSNSSRIDMAEYESVTFLTTITDSANTGVAHLKIEESDDDADTNMAAVTGADATATDAGGDALNGKLLVAGYYKPNKRYVQAVRASTVANIAFGECLAVLVPKRLPAVQGATVLDTASVAN